MICGYEYLPDYDPTGGGPGEYQDECTDGFGNRIPCVKAIDTKVFECQEGYVMDENGNCVAILQIDDSALKPCMKTILDSIKSLTNDMNGIISIFAGNTQVYNWKLTDGPTLNGGTGQTNATYDSSSNTVTSTFYTQKYSDASDLSWARTILHESAHAYIVVSIKTNYTDARKNFADMIKEWNTTNNPNFNDIQHAEFVRNYVDEIKSSLKEFGIKKGYNLNDQFYNDMAWGGLTHWSKKDSSGAIIKDSNGDPISEETPWFKTTFPLQFDRDRILKTNAIESTKKDMNGTIKTQKGTNAGC